MVNSKANKNTNTTGLGALFVLFITYWYSSVIKLLGIIAYYLSRIILFLFTIFYRFSFVTPNIFCLSLYPFVMSYILSCTGPQISKINKQTVEFSPTNFSIATYVSKFLNLHFIDAPVLLSFIVTTYIFPIPFVTVVFLYKFSFLLY